MLAYVASGPSGSHSTLVCGTVAPGDQRSGVWHAVAHGCFPVQRQSGISSCVKQAHATLNFNADTKTRSGSPPILMCCGTTSSVAAIRIADTLADDVSVDPAFIKETRQWAQETHCPMLQQAGYRTRELQSENTQRRRPASSFCLTSSATPQALCEQHAVNYWAPEEPRSSQPAACLK